MSTGSIRIVSASLLGAALLFSTAQSFAAPIVGVPDSNGNGKVDLADIIATGATGFSIGDKKFSGFSYTPSGSNSPAASDISVDDFSTSSGEALRFGFGWFTLNGINMDSRIDYRVDVLDPNPATMIDSVDLGFNGIASGVAVGDVAETVNAGDAPHGFLGLLKVFTDPDGALPQQAQYVDSLKLVPLQRSILVDKDIQLFSAPTGGALPLNFASISFVDNSYHQTPEPVSVASLGIAGCMYMLRRRRIA